jgi:hypothetical protein
MRKVYWMLAMLALPFVAANSCGGDDSTPGAAGASATGSGGRTGTTASSTVATTTGTGTGGSAGR